MLKNILELKGAQQLSKKEQSAITGSASCTCVFDLAEVQGPVANCDQCFDYCGSIGASETWCFGGGIQ